MHNPGCVDMENTFFRYLCHVTLLWLTRLLWRNVFFQDFKSQGLASCTRSARFLDDNTKQAHNPDKREQYNNNFANFCKPPPLFCGTNADQDWWAMLILRQMHTFCRSNSHNSELQVIFFQHWLHSRNNASSVHSQIDIFPPDYPGPFRRVHGTEFLRF